MTFLLESNGIVSGEENEEKTAVPLEDGDVVTVTAKTETPLRFIFAMAKPLGEPRS